jgi:hypothetical protein
MDILKALRAEESKFVHQLDTIRAEWNRRHPKGIRHSEDGMADNDFIEKTGIESAPPTTSIFHDRRMLRRDLIG